MPEKSWLSLPTATLAASFVMVLGAVVAAIIEVHCSGTPSPSNVASTPRAAPLEGLPTSVKPSLSGESKSHQEPKSASVSTPPSSLFNLESLPLGAERPLALGLCGYREELAFAPQAIAGELSSAGYSVTTKYFGPGFQRSEGLRELCRGRGRFLAKPSAPRDVAFLTGTLDGLLRKSEVNDGLVTSEISLSYSFFNKSGAVKTSDHISAIGAGFTRSQARSQSVERLAVKLRKALAEQDL